MIIFIEIFFRIAESHLIEGEQPQLASWDREGLRSKGRVRFKRRKELTMPRSGELR